jgi:DNA recombination protein RmuC
MAEATNSLARALKGNAKVRGDWGEMILDTVLKASGLVEDVNYVRQETSTDEESGKRRKPDVVINLPDGRQVVVDSKVNLIAWSEACNAETPAEYEDAMVRHTAAMRQHVKDLVDRNYPRVLGTQALDMTIMFVPIEGALSAALSVNSDLQSDALTKRVVFASPNTLMAMLRVVERLWTRDKLQRQVDIIGTEAGKVLDALIDFMSEFDDIQKHIGRTEAAFRAAKNRLHDSDRSVINRAKRLVEAGAKGRKQIPEALQVIGAPPPLPMSLEPPQEETA